MSKSLHNLNRKRKATHKLVKMGVDPAKKAKGAGETNFSEKNAHKATSCTKMRKTRYGIEKQPDKKLVFAKMPRKMKKQIKKELLSA